MRPRRETWGRITSKTRRGENGHNPEKTGAGRNHSGTNAYRFNVPLKASNPTTMTSEHPKSVEMRRLSLPSIRDYGAQGSESPSQFGPKQHKPLQANNLSSNPRHSFWVNRPRDKHQDLHDCATLSDNSTRTRHGSLSRDALAACVATSMGGNVASTQSQQNDAGWIVNLAYRSCVPLHASDVANMDLVSAKLSRGPSGGA